MTILKRLLIPVLLLSALQAWGQVNRRDPWMGFVYPAGGQQGTTVQITAGGQLLKGATQAYVSGTGVHVTVAEWEGPFGPFTRPQLEELGRRLKAIRDQRIAALANKPAPTPAAADPSQPPVTLPDLPELRGLEQMTLPQLKAIADKYLSLLGNPRKPPLSERVALQVTVDANAAPGDRELRLVTPGGLSNPMRFEVGTLPEVLEQEPNTLQDPPAPALTPPVVLNGQIMPGDDDTYRLHLQQGQKLVLAAQARRLMPYLADAVPGWFQATLSLYDSQGKQVAYDDDYRFDPDPVLLYQVPRDGEYTVEIHDSIWRGREDFVYRLTIGEVLFITSLFPLGGRAGVATTATATGWNLPSEQVQLDTTPGGDWLRYAAWPGPQGTSNVLPYAVDTLPEVTETEPNDTLKSAERVTLPEIINGRIAQPGDVDYFRFEGQAGQEVVAEVYARRLSSPLDSLVRLLDASGKVLALNDDQPDKEAGLITDHADSYLRFRLPSAGACYVQISDVQHHGGEEYAYRLRISPPRPDFALRLSPSSLSVPAGRVVAATVTAIRKDGFNGDITVAIDDAPPGFSLSGGLIPAGRDQVTLTLLAPPRPLSEPVDLRLVGTAQIGGEQITRPVIPADNMMQAFAYWHLVPSQELLAQVTQVGRGAPSLRFANDGPIQVPAGGTAELQLTLVPGAARMLQQQPLELQLKDPPPGISLGEVTAVPGGLGVAVKADAATAKVGYADNLIVEVFTQVSFKRPDGTQAPKQRVSLGLLPALPFQIVQP